MRCLFLLLPIMLLACAPEPASETKALPFACGPEEVSKFFGPEHMTYLRDQVRSTSQIRNLTVFGASFSDAGLLNEKTLDALAPRCSHWLGRFSNGPIWNDYLAGAFGLTHRSYAVGGAQTLKENVASGWLDFLPYLDPLKIRESAQDILLSPFEAQIEAWEKGRKGRELDQELFAIWLGPNDYLNHAKDFRDANGQLDLRRADEHRVKVIDGLEQGLRRLARQGARHFVLANAPRLDDFAEDHPSPIREDLSRYLTDSHNLALETLVDRLASEGLSVYLFDTHALFTRARTEGEDLGFSSDARCFKGSIAGYPPLSARGFCEAPLSTRFWDEQHPNTRLHCHLVGQFLDDVGEPLGLFATQDIHEACKDMRTEEGLN